MQCSLQPTQALSLDVFSGMVGMARSAVPAAVPARVVAGGTNSRVTLAFEEVAPLHAARTSQRDVPTTLNTYDACPTLRFMARLLPLFAPALGP